MKIRQLPEEVVSKIAAGEIVERPANIIKELIENSLDANSTQIEVYVEKAGKRKIIVADNGEGIEKEDLLNAIKKHHTSKIKSVEDLYTVISYGFRGEALYSISSVSKFKIISRTTNSVVGNELYVEGGSVKHLQEVGTSIGTKVMVLDLFYNLPARVKFLKTDNTESFHNITTFLSYAISNPSVHFKYYSDGSLVYNLYPAQIEDRVKQIFNKDFIRIEHESIVGSLKGFIFNQKHKISYLFLNGRPVRSPVVLKVLKEMLGDVSYLIFLELPPYSYDINIHPSKLYVKFQNDKAVVNLIKSALEKSSHKREAVSYLLSQPKLSYSREQDFEVLGVVEDTFILAYWKGEVYFIDFHVANERVMYDILRRKLETGEGYQYQPLLSPMELDLSEENRNKLLSLVAYLRKVGYRFRIEDKVFITAIPYRMSPAKALQAIYELLTERLEDPMESVLSKVSCRLSFMSGDKVEIQEAQALLREWIKTDNPHLCPHGRRIYHKISMDEVRQAVGRK